MACEWHGYNHMMILTSYSISNQQLFLLVGPKEFSCVLVGVTTIFILFHPIRVHSLILPLSLAKKQAAIDKEIPLQPMDLFTEAKNTPVNKIDSGMEN